MPQPEPIHNPVYVSLLKEIIVNQGSEGTSKTRDLIKDFHVESIARWVGEGDEAREKRSRTAAKIKKEKHLHTQTCKINRQISTLEELGIVNRPIKEGPQACVKIDWDSWARRIASKVTKHKLRDQEYSSIGVVFEKFFKNSFRMRGKDKALPSLNTLEDQFISFVGLVNFKTGYEVAGLEAPEFSSMCAMKLYHDLDSRCGGLARQGLELTPELELKEM